MNREERVQACREWIARRTAQVDQLEKRYNALYDIRSPQENLKVMNDLDSLRFWIDIHRWELEQLIEEGGDYPQQTNND